MTGSAGTDIVGDGAGADHVDLAAGDDRLIVAQDEDADTCEEGEGTDTLDLSHLTDGVTVDLATGALTRTDAATDGIDGFEIVIGTGQDDVFRIGNVAVTLTGGEGFDLYVFDGDGELGEIKPSIARAETCIGEIRLQILAITATARTDAQRKLSGVEPRPAKLNEGALAIQDRPSRTDVRPPVAGTVNELNVHTISGVVAPAEVLVTIVPVDLPLRVDIRLSPGTIEQIHQDQVARLRFPAFSERVTPELIGRVIHVPPPPPSTAGPGSPTTRAPWPSRRRSWAGSATRPCWTACRWRSTSRRRSALSPPI